MFIDVTIFLVIAGVIAVGILIFGFKQVTKYKNMTPEELEKLDDE